MFPNTHFQLRTKNTFSNNAHLRKKKQNDTHTHTLANAKRAHTIIRINRKRQQHQQNGQETFGLSEWNQPTTEFDLLATNTRKNESNKKKSKSCEEKQRRRFNKFLYVLNPLPLNSKPNESEPNQFKLNEYWRQRWLDLHKFQLQNMITL